jgi:chromosome segregation ATPase
MSTATLDAPAVEPLRGLMAGLADAEAGRAAELLTLLEPIERALGELNEWADRLDAAEQAAANAQQQFASQERAADQRRRKLEHDLRLARDRVIELERSLQERTEELLRVQQANNELAAQLREIGDDETLEAGAEGETASEDGDLMIITDSPAPEGGEGVAERFARLRRS